MELLAGLFTGRVKMDFPLKSVSDQVPGPEFEQPISAFEFISMRRGTFAPLWLIYMGLWPVPSSINFDNTI